MRGAMHHEAIWRSWFEGAGGLVPKSTAVALCSAPASQDCAHLLEQAGGKQSDVLSRQHLFSVHVHAGPDFKGYPRGHVFAKALLDTSVKVRQAIPASESGCAAGLHWVAPACMRGWLMCSFVLLLQVRWGQHSGIDAVRLLLAAALADPANQRFQILCEVTG